MAGYKPPLQLQIPVALPGILKEYTKAVLKFQPDDLYSWSAMYFRELADCNSSAGLVKSAKQQNLATDAQERIIDFDGWKSIYNKIRDSHSISYENLRQIWLAEKFSESQLKELLTIGEFFSGEINLNKFTVLVCASVASNLRKTMQLFIGLVSGNESLTAKISYDLFESSYKFVSSLDSEISSNTIETFLNHMKHLSVSNGGYIMVADFLNKSCPNLE